MREDGRWRNVAPVNSIDQPNKEVCAPTQHLFNKRQAAKYTTLCVRSIELAVRKKKLAVIKFGARAVRFKKTDLDSFIERHRLRALAG